MPYNLAQPVEQDASGAISIAYDWYPRPLPRNIFLGEMAYPDTAYSFRTFFSEKETGLSLGYASGNYGHSIFATGKDGEIKIGDFVVLQCLHIISNLSVRIGNHCMFSWGSVITDSWIDPVKNAPAVRRIQLEKAAASADRQLRFEDPKPVSIGDNVWVGFGTVILPGVNIGRGAVIGCKTIIAEDVPPYAVVVGDPARIIKYLEPTDTEEVRRDALKQFGILL